jgi:ankyrin repeat protein
MKEDDKRFDAAHRIIKRGDLLALRRELQTGLDPNLRNRYGWTLLMLTALHGRTDMAEVLIAAGADASTVNKFGDSAASLAELKKHKRTKTIVEPVNQGDGE